jgi:hypothetical protein
MNRVDLQLRHLPDGVEHIGFGGLAAWWRKQALSGQMQGAGSGQGQSDHADGVGLALA